MKEDQMKRKDLQADWDGLSDKIMVRVAECRQINQRVRISVGMITDFKEIQSFPAFRRGLIA
jgi:hypothetical protein